MEETPASLTFGRVYSYTHEHAHSAGAGMCFQSKGYEGLFKQRTEYGGHPEITRVGVSSDTSSDFPAQDEKP